MFTIDLPITAAKENFNWPTPNTAINVTTFAEKPTVSLQRAGDRIANAPLNELASPDLTIDTRPRALKIRVCPTNVIHSRTFSWPGKE